MRDISVAGAFRYIEYTKCCTAPPGEQLEHEPLFKKIMFPAISPRTSCKKRPRGTWGAFCNYNVLIRNKE